MMIKADFAEDIDTVQLENAKLLKLELDNQFQIKYFLERQDTTTNYLIYAPFSKPDVRENHLEDTMLYSKRFYAVRASLLSVDLGIEEKYMGYLYYAFTYILYATSRRFVIKYQSSKTPQFLLRFYYE